MKQKFSKLDDATLLNDLWVDLGSIQSEWGKQRQQFAVSFRPSSFLAVILQHHTSKHM